MKVAVTGATGVIGRRVVRLLIAAGHQPTAVLRPGSPRREMLPAGCAVAEASLFDRRQLLSAFDGHEIVINLATHIPASMLAMLRRSAWRENDRIRTEGSRTLASAAADAGVAGLIQESVALAYPSRGDAWIDESVTLEPGANGVSVLAAEAAAARFADRGGRGVALRFANFYGPDASQTRIMARSVKAGWAPVPGDRSSFISSISHDDAAAAVAAALGIPSGAYNVSDDHPMARGEFFDIIARQLKVGSPRFLPAWSAHLMGFLGPILTRSIRLSNRKLRRASSWAPAAPSAAEGLGPAVAGAMAE